MVKRKWIIGTSSVLLILLLFASYMAVASETTGREDPVVSLNYLKDVLAPETIDKVNALIDTKASAIETELDLKLTEYYGMLEATIQEFESRNQNIATDPSFVSAVSNAVLAGLSDTGTGGGAGSAITGGFELVQVNAGETYKFKVGGMILLRIGDAKCYTPSSPGLIDITSGSELEGGGSLQKNHLYMVTVEDRGFTASSDCKIMVFGSYTIS